MRGGPGARIGAATLRACGPVRPDVAQPRPGALTALVPGGLGQSRFPIPNRTAGRCADTFSQDSPNYSLTLPGIIARAVPNKTNRGVSRRMSMADNSEFRDLWARVLAGDDRAASEFVRRF